ncbi:MULTISPECIES: LppA family lipoprotein [Mycolicibacter]|uniref:LppA family lipoprotein n=1 Tax=Mycolicibacter TaxID=1073531 RepID=UPI000A62CD17|nr:MULTISPECIES: LppA family lipoprotein [Mycobacteriaceae]ULP47749.2 LppA family lipoprotein [Mycolicibacter virginiensis]
MFHQVSPPQPRRCLFAVLAIVALTAGCHVSQPYEPTPPSVAAEALAVLKSLPSFEDTQTQVAATMNEITAAAKQLIPSIVWETLDEGDGGNCERPYEQTDGKRYFLPDAVARDVTVSEQAWAKLEEAAKAAAAKLDATEIQVMQDQPGNHDVGFYGPTGLFIKVGYRGNLVVSGYTGCRLPQDKK